MTNNGTINAAGGSLATFLEIAERFSRLSVKQRTQLSNFCRQVESGDGVEAELFEATKKDSLLLSVVAYFGNQPHLPVVADEAKQVLSFIFREDYHVTQETGPAGLCN